MPKAMKFRNHRTISCISCTAKIVMRMLSRRIEQKTEDELEED